MIGNKMTLQYKVDKQVLERLDDNIVVEKSLNFLYVKFIFSDEWRGLTKYALFNYIDIDSPYKLEVNKDGIVKVPYDLITFPGFLITLQGVNKSGVRITTETRMVDVQLLGTIDADEKAVKYVTSDNNTINIDKNGDELDLGIETQLEYAPDTHTLNLYAITHNEKDDDGEPIEVETLLSSVELDNSIIEKTYAELSTMKDNGELIAGQQYRIIDYVTTTNGKINNIENLSRSVGHSFDIVVEAISTNQFSENARALLHSGDNYFANNDLNSWQLWYCFDNDTTRFEWADTTNGKGVIYRMIDEFENDLPYDFKNIQFKRFKITATTDSRQNAFIGKYYAFNGTHYATYDTNDFTWNYTCCDMSGNDLSIQSVNDHSYSNCRYVKQLKIGAYLSDEPTYRGAQSLNDIVLISPSMIVDVKMGVGSTKNTIIGNEDMTYAYFGEMCRRNIICGEIAHTRTDECFQENLIGTGDNSIEAFHFVRTGRHFENNIVIKINSSIFKDAAYNNIFPNMVSFSTFHSLFNRNDWGGLNDLQYGDIYRSLGTNIYGTGSWTFVKVMGYMQCEIHIDNLYGSVFNFLQQVTFNKTEGTTINILSMEFDTILGSPTVINLSDLVPYNISGSRSFKRLCGARIDGGNAGRFEYTCKTIENGAPKLVGAYSIDNGATWTTLNVPNDCYIVTTNDYTLPEHYDASRGNDLYGWMTNGKITFSEDFAKVLKETKRPICISMDILSAWCPNYYTTNDAYDYVIFTPASSNSSVDGSGEEEYDVDEIISYEAQENTDNVFGILLDYTPKLTFIFSKHVTGFPSNPKQVTADVYDSEMLFERKSKAKTIFGIEIYHDDFNKLKYNGHLELTTHSLASGVNEIICGVTVYEPDNSVDMETMVIFSRPSLYGDYYCTPTILFYDFYVRAEMLKLGGVDTVRFIRVDKPTYILTLTNFNRVSEDGTYIGWDALDIGKIEFIFGQEQLDDFVTKVANIVTTYYSSISTPTNMYDVVGVLNTLFDYDLTYADASSPIIPFALCQLIASARSVTNINITQTKITYHNVQTSCDLNNGKMDIIAFSDFSSTIGGDSLVEDATHYYRLVGHWEFT